MSGTKYGYAKVILANARVGNDITYYPGHVKNGRPVDECLKFTAFTNDRNGNNAIIDCSIWRKRARLMAWMIGPGLQFQATAVLRSYKGRIFEITGHNPTTNEPIYSPMRNADTSLRLVNKMGCSIDDFEIGEPSQNLIDLEIQMGIRNADWDQESGKATWQTMMANRNKFIGTPWDGVSQKLGPFARVGKIQNAEVVYKEGVPPEVKAQYRAVATGVGTMTDAVSAAVKGAPSPSGPTVNAANPYGNLMAGNGGGSGNAAVAPVQTVVAPTGETTFGPGADVGTMPQLV